MTSSDSTSSPPRIFCFDDQPAWEQWLALHHNSSPGVWLRLAKKGSAAATVTYAQALDAALCYGWIDGQKKRESDTAWLQRFVPRAKRSIWSKINRQKVTALVESGRMQPSGLAEMERAKKDGRWDAAYDSPSNAVVPEDFQAALDKNAKARAFFATLESRNRYAVLFRIQTVKKPETRARRIREFVAMLARHEKFHP
ncbi:MAG: YdeI/OmpD-associated family protein [Acidobacteriaceae bacterium]